MNYSYTMPTRVVFGKGCVAAQGRLFRNYGGKALIVTGRASARACGALDDVCTALDRVSIAWKIFDRVLPNPPIENVRAGAELARKERVDMIIGIGGGSPMDAAKAVALLATNDLDDTGLFSGAYEREPLPVLAVPTTAGTGSEVTPYSIITDMNDKTKKNLSHPGLFPKVAFLDATYLEALPHQVTVNTTLDALSHAVESYISARNHEMSALYARQAMGEIGPCLKLLAGNASLGFDMRERLLHASMLAGIAIAQTGTTMVHAMGYALTFFESMDHGKANAVLLCEALRFCYGRNRDKIDQMMTLMGMDSIDELQACFESLIGRPDPVPQDRLAFFADKTMGAKSLANTVPEPTPEDVFSVYQKALG